MSESIKKGCGLILVGVFSFYSPVFASSSDCGEIPWYDSIGGYSAKVAQYGEGIITVIIDPGYIKPLDSVFDDRCYYLNKTDAGQWYVQKTSMDIFPFEEHATSVAALVGGKCCEIEENCWFPFLRGGCDKKKITGIASKAFIIGFPTRKFKKAGLVTGFENFQSIQHFFNNTEGLDFGIPPKYNINNKNRELFKVPRYGLINISGGSNIDIDEAKEWENWSIAHKRNIPLVIIAVGNDGRELKPEDTLREFPHSLYKQDFVILVAATEAKKNSEGNFELLSNSNYGEQIVHIAAPGEITTTNIEGRAVEKRATSFAAPVVAGTAALLLSCNSNLQAHEIKDIILESADRYNSLKGKIIEGRFLNVEKAIDRACKKEKRLYAEKPKSCPIDDFFNNFLEEINSIPRCQQKQEADGKKNDL